LGALQTFKSYQANIVGIEMDDDGVNIEALEAAMAAHKPKFFYTIPTFQNPTGCTMGLEKRQKVYALAKHYGTLILEDDPYGSVRFYGEPLPAIASFDTDGRVMHLNSFSKTVSPGLRVGAAVGQADILRAMVINKQGVDTHTSNLSQAVVDAYIRGGHYFKHIQEMLPPYRAQLSAMLDGFAHFPEGTRHTKPEGGLFVWCELPEGFNTVELMPKAIERKVAFVPGTYFFPEGEHLNTLRLNFSACEPDLIEVGMKRLGSLLCEQAQ
jgi:2-aminoadipate transaminase